MLLFVNALFFIASLFSLVAMFVSIFAANWPHGIGFALLFALFYFLFCKLPNPPRK